MTLRSVVAAITHDDSLSIRLLELLGDGCELVTRSTPQAMGDALQGTSPCVLIADARHIDDGGHQLERYLSEAAETYAGLLILIFREADCPEPLQRLIACAPPGTIVKLGSLREIAATAANHLNERAADAQAASKSVQDEPPAEIAMQGVTSRFETNSVPLKRMLEDLSVAADHDVTILLIGETGSGKTFLSRLIHEASSRRNEPFLHVACGALPRELIESELFGHVKGAFTSAHADKEGKFIAARRGTVLLDEIDVLGPEQQVKLLRVIETGEFEPVGSNQTLRSQARLVVASNLDLQPLVDQGKFRPDLYYRLNMLKFEIPPLRKRRVDIIPLAKQFIRKYQQKHKISIARIEESLLEALVNYPWPGNVRELENVIQRAVIYCRNGVLTVRQLPEHIVAGAAGPTNDPSVRLDAYRPVATQTLDRQIAMTEREIIEQALYQNDHSKTKTAKALGISRVTLYNKLKKLQISN